jgi:NDP-sugar pyrophosphorylase family protein
MKVIIPMSGLGSRFIASGYFDPKPLIKVHGKPIIDWVVKMFSPCDDFIFICRDEHLQNTNMRQELERVAPRGQIISIQNHKRGPVYAVSKIFNQLQDDEPILVSYCDYYMRWNYEAFKKAVLKAGIDGSVPCYHGFHPNLLPKKNLYAGCLKDKKNMLLEIREKFSFAQDKIQGFHSPGVYFFKDGATVKKYFQMALDENLSINDEFYVSLVYQLMLRDKKQIYVFDDIDFFCQWGTPQDLQEYLFWINQVKDFSA